MLSVIIPVYNEETAIVDTINAVKKTLDGFVEHEVIVVNDGSTDASLKKIKECGMIKDIEIINHVENLGYGKSLYDGILAAKYNYIGILDADGTYPVDEFKDLYQYLSQYDMVVGSRTGKEFKKGLSRRLFNFLAEYATGRAIPDVNSGFRLFRRDIVLGFKDFLCTGFSFTTTLTLLFLLNQHYVKYVPIKFYKRKGRSKVKRFKDTLRAGQIIIEAILHNNPLKLFLLFAVISLITGLILLVVYFLILKENIIALLSGLLIASFAPLFSFGLICEQIRNIYRIGKEK